MDGIAGFTYYLSDTVAQNYFYRKNAQGDITGIYDNNYNLLCEYVYDAWGNHKIIVDETNANAVFIANLNPFRYRGYYFDTETGLYYLNSRYYDPELGRFVNADDISYLDIKTLNGLNLYAYCGNNPVNKIDRTGHWWFFDDIIAAAVGFIVGVVGQLVSDIVTSIVNKEWSFSSWETYAGAAVGGAVGGWTSLYVGPVAGTAIGSGVSTFIGQGLECLTGTNVRSFSEILMNTAIATSIGAITGGFVKYIKIPGITSGSHSFTQVWKSGVTKSLKYGYHMAFKTIIKGFVSEGVRAFSVGWLINSTIVGLINGLKNN